MKRYARMDFFRKYCAMVILEGAVIMIAAVHAHSQVVLGLENLLIRQLDLVEGKQVGIIANHTSLDAQGRSIVDLISQHAKVIAVFGPEHGYRGNVDDGADIQDSIEGGLRVFSLYGAYREPTREMLKDIDVLIYDIQDVGVKFYTFISSLFLAMEAAKRDGIQFIVLDRPNPIDASRVEGSITLPPNASFVGAAPLPTRYGMTAGELAQMFNRETYLGFSLNANLTVVKMTGYKRTMWYDETGLPWTKTSPNMPDLETATVYPGMCLFEGTNLSEGRGTPTPFMTVGAPYIDSEKWLMSIPKALMAGVEIRAVSFTPRSIVGMDENPKYKDVPCDGLRLHVIDRRRFQPIPLSVAMLCSAAKNFETDFKTRNYLDNLWGNEDLRAMLESGEDYASIMKTTEEGLERFRKIRGKYLLYD
ncbi:MAG: DUF1343 domain-containing protein [Candidatus Omnitrophota bacterium]